VANKRRALGRGLDALIPASGATPGLRRVAVEAIRPNPKQPRSVFDENALQELTDSIRQVGLIQPLVVHQVPSADADAPPRYELITGERRWRAAQRAGLQHVDVIVKEVSPLELLELALIENIQRSDLNPLEEASAYQQLADEFGMTHEQIAERVGRSRVSVTNSLRLLRLPTEIKSGLLEARISEGHARALLMLEDADEQLLAYRRVLRGKLSVRQTEELVRRLRSTPEAPTKETRRSPETVHLEQQFRDSLGTKVDLFRSRKGGRVVIHFYSEEDLQTLYDRFVGADDL